MQEIDIDSRINWKQFYSRYMQLKGSGDHLSARCVFHDDRQASLSINVRTGQYKCHACSATGNAYTFLQEHERMTPQQAVEAIKREAGIDTASPKKTKEPPPGLTVAEYAVAKKLPEDFLETECFLANGVLKQKKYMLIKYLDEAGAIAAQRRRWGLGKGLFTWVTGSKTMFYGLWRMEHLRTKGYVILVEGESDCHTLWLHGIPALGAPGADTPKAEWMKQLDGLNVYLFKEPDDGGSIFLEKTCTSLLESRFTGKVFRVAINGFKDPSALHIDNPDAFEKRWQEAMDAAEAIDLEKAVVKIQERVPGEPFHPNLPRGWIYDADGVYQLTPDGSKIRVCPSPVIISKRIKNIDTGEEKIELSFFRDEQWQKIIVPRSVAFQKKTVTSLTDMSLPITSETAGPFVTYLGGLEAENMNTIPIAYATDRMGWISDTKFLPGLADDVVMDVDPGSASYVNAYKPKGSFERWRDAVLYVRTQPIARMFMAASFASPLLSLIGHRVFFIHAWGASRGGKTAALKAALSAWGDPELLMATFNATAVGLERIAGFYSDLPLAIDERQIAGKNQESIEQKIYQLATGKGRMRGTKSGGLQATKSWKSIILTTGEEPLSNDSSQTGIKTRTLELFGKPLADEHEGQRIHTAVYRDYGHAGPMFIARLLAEMHKNKSFLHDDYKYVFSELERIAPDHMGAHLSAVAVCCVADYYVSQWLFGMDPAPARIEMARFAQQIVSLLETTSDTEYVERGWSFVCSWVASNKENFKSGAKPQLGFADPGSLKICIDYEQLREALRKANFNHTRLLKDLGEAGRIEKSVEAGKTRYDLLKRWNGIRTRMVVLNGLQMEMDFV